MCWMYVIQDNDLESHVLFGSDICCEKCMCPLDVFVGSTGYWVDLICIPFFWKISWKTMAFHCYKMCVVPSAIQPWQGVWIFPHQNSADFVMNSAAEYEDWGGYLEMLWKGKKKEVVAHFPRWMCLPLNYINKSARKSGPLLVGCIWGSLFLTHQHWSSQILSLFPQDGMVEFRIVR